MSSAGRCVAAWRAEKQAQTDRLYFCSGIGHAGVEGGCAVASQQEGA